MSELSPKELKIVEAAQALFLHHGFKRVTMSDIANAVDISRPALYLIFPNKEEIFEAAIRHRGLRTLAELRQSLPAKKTIADKLSHVFELWTVHTFEILQRSPDARDMIECTQGFARPTFHIVKTEFENIVREILSELAPRRGKYFSASALAHLLVTANQGFKLAAVDSAELRGLIAGQIAVVLTALENVPARNGGTSGLVPG